MCSPINCIRPALLNKDGLECWFTLRNETLNRSEAHIAGLNLGFNTEEKKSVIRQNRKQLLELIGTDPEHFAFATQVHKTQVEGVKAGGQFDDTDALVSATPGIALAIQVADCAAVLLGDSKNGVIGAVHAGWRGAVGNIVPKTISKIKALGGQTSELKAFVSPCISLSKFEVGTEVASEFPSQFVDYTSYAKPHVDLKGFIKHQLNQQGIADERIEVDSACTISEEQFYSYRRQKNSSGRMMGIIKLS
ncbi:MAG: peptidoglycan editing factor PgeF [Balneolaceae bacterium]|nr:peptidoglycan editing factor PgeF [Balneolaceae bacterium]